MIARLGPQTRLTPTARLDNFSGSADRLLIGNRTVIKGRLVVQPMGKIVIGEGCYIGERTEIRSLEKIEIGNGVIIQHGVNIIDNSAHSLNAPERHRHLVDIQTSGHPKARQALPGVESAPIIIEDDVWIGFRASVLKGVRIGRGSVIAPGALVLNDVPGHSYYDEQIVAIIMPLEQRSNAK